MEETLIPMRVVVIHVYLNRYITKNVVLYHTFCDISFLKKGIG